MAYRDDDMTYAVEEYARTHPEGKLFWTDIVDWIHEKENIENDRRLADLVGIRDYQFFRKVIRKGKETYRECKKRFDEINEARVYANCSKIPRLMSAVPEEFLVLPFSQQREAIIEMQEEYSKQTKEFGDYKAKYNKTRIDEAYIARIEQRVENVELVIQRALKKSSKQLDSIMKVLNEREARLEMEQKGITVDGIDRNKIIDILEDQSKKLYSIKDDIAKYRKVKKGEQQKENINKKEEQTEIKEKKISWVGFNESLLEDDDD